MSDDESKKFPKYWMCDPCAKKAGGVVPMGQGAITVCKGTCAHCGHKDVVLVPWVDYDWPKNREKTIKARISRD